MVPATAASGRNPIRLQGTLKKQSEHSTMGFHRWRDRFFTLQENVLCCFRAEDDDNIMHEFRLDSMHFAVFSKKNDHGIVLQIPGKGRGSSPSKLLLKSATHEDAVLWFDAMMASNRWNTTKQYPASSLFERLRRFTPASAENLIESLDGNKHEDRALQSSDPALPHGEHFAGDPDEKKESESKSTKSNLVMSAAESQDDVQEFVIDHDDDSSEVSDILSDESLDLPDTSVSEIPKLVDSSPLEKSHASASASAQLPQTNSSKPLTATDMPTGGVVHSPAEGKSTGQKDTVNASQSSSSVSPPASPSSAPGRRESSLPLLPQSPPPPLPPTLSTGNSPSPTSSNAPDQPALLPIAKSGLVSSVVEKTGMPALPADVGLGVQLVVRPGADYPVVEQMLKGCSAHESGRLSVGDTILSANSASLKKATSKQASASIVGPRGTLVVLRVRRHASKETEDGSVDVPLLRADAALCNALGSQLNAVADCLYIKDTNETRIAELEGNVEEVKQQNTLSQQEAKQLQSKIDQLQAENDAFKAKAPAISRDQQCQTVAEMVDATELNDLVSVIDALEQQIPQAQKQVEKSQAEAMGLRQKLEDSIMEQKDLHEQITTLHAALEDSVAERDQLLEDLEEVQRSARKSHSSPQKQRFVHVGPLHSNSEEFVATIDSPSRKIAGSLHGHVGGGIVVGDKPDLRNIGGTLDADTYAAACELHRLVGCVEALNRKGGDSVAIGELIASLECEKGIQCQLDSRSIPMQADSSTHEILMCSGVQAHIVGTSVSSQTENGSDSLRQIVESFQSCVGKLHAASSLEIPLSVNESAKAEWNENVVNRISIAANAIDIEQTMETALNGSPLWTQCWMSLVSCFSNIVAAVQACTHITLRHVEASADISAQLSMTKSELRQTTDASNDLAAKLQTSTLEFSQEIESTRSESAAWKQAVQLLQEHLQSASIKIDQQESALAHSREEISNLTAKRSELEMAAEDREQKLSAAGQVIEKAEELALSLQNYESRISELEKYVESLEVRLHESNDECAQLSAKCARLFQSARQSQQEQELAEAKSSALAEECKQLKIKCNAASEALGLLQGKFSQMSGVAERFAKMPQDLVLMTQHHAQKSGHARPTVSSSSVAAQTQVTGASFNDILSAEPSIQEPIASGPSFELIALLKLVARTAKDADESIVSLSANVLASLDAISGSGGSINGQQSVGAMTNQLTRIRSQVRQAGSSEHRAWLDVLEGVIIEGRKVRSRIAKKVAKTTSSYSAALRSHQTFIEAAAQLISGCEALKGELKDKITRSIDQ